MPMMFPMNWVLLSLILVFLIHLSDKKMYTLKSKELKKFNSTYTKKWQW